MTKVTFKDRKSHGESNIERYCEDCGNFDGFITYLSQNGYEETKPNPDSKRCKKCRYLAPSMYTPIPPRPEPDVIINDQEIIDEHHRMKYGEY